MACVLTALTVTTFRIILEWYIIVMLHNILPLYSWWCAVFSLYSNSTTNWPGHSLTWPEGLWPSYKLLCVLFLISPWCGYVHYNLSQLIVYLKLSYNVLCTFSNELRHFNHYDSYEMYPRLIIHRIWWYGMFSSSSYPFGGSFAVTAIIWSLARSTYGLTCQDQWTLMIRQSQ